MSDWNRRIIEEFRANGGSVGGRFEGRPLLLLHHTGAKSRVVRVTPLAYQRVDDGYAVFGSAGGSPRNPDWFHNLVTNPNARVEVGSETVDVVAHVAEGSEREEIWERQKREVPAFAEYDRTTTREIPVVVLRRVPAAGSGKPHVRDNPAGG